MYVVRTLCFACLVVFTTVIEAVSTQRLGDIGSYAIPLTSASAALVLKDFQGLLQLGLATAVVQGTTEGLKAITTERRPNGVCCNSFPSGHTSLAFTGASFMQFRYGLRYSIPSYAAATYVAYSRVEVKAHYLHDVAAGAVLGIAGTYLSTTKYMPLNHGDIAIVAEPGFAGIIYRKIFD